MRIVNDTIELKSTPENYFKERDNLKCNTVRRFDKWSEMREFEQFRMEFDHKIRNKKIKILGYTFEEFERTITDITQFEGYWIISWQDTRVI